MHILQIIFRKTLNNVVLGIALMVAIALYIAIGSGIVSVREYFEMTPLEFFNAWPLKLLMLLLCVTLATVTWNRIPLTPPRYGVWCIHCGIITLILGTSLYYHLKIEGRVPILVGHTVNSYYDSEDRALYARAVDQPIYLTHPLPSLPRFGEFDQQSGADRLNRPDLTNIAQMTPIGLDSDKPVDLASLVGSNDPIRLDIIGFHPYADVQTEIEPDPTAGNSGVRMEIANPHGASEILTLTNADPTQTKQVIGNVEFEHRAVSQSSMQMIEDSAAHLLQISYALPGQEIKKLDVDLGKDIPLGDTGYTVAVQSYDPDFQMFGTLEHVAALTLHVVAKSPAPLREFWRMILAGKPLQTDFKMDPMDPATPPMVQGNRQKEPIDKDLVLGFTMNDPASLMPAGGMEKHTFFTTGDNSLIDIDASLTGGIKIKDFSNGGDIQIPFQGSSFTAHVQRMDHFRVLAHAVITPIARRTNDVAESGVKQVLIVRVTAGKFSQDVTVPCNLEPDPDPMTFQPMDDWQMGTVQIPGAKSVLQLQLGYVTRPLPATLTLKKFELVHYPGGEGQNGPFRDFISTLEMDDPSGEHSVGMASNNSPIYYHGGQWIFFQAGYEPDGTVSTIGIGNRPGVGIMTTGCIMIVTGLLYAFYVKPIVIRRMKKSALARFAAAGVKPPREALAGSKP